MCEACGEPRPPDGPADLFDSTPDAGDEYGSGDGFDVEDGDFDDAGFDRRAGDTTGGVIPYKNPPALIAYYCRLFSGFPLLGLPLGVAGFVLGIIGLKRRRENPAVKGSVHAWIGIGCGGFFALLWGVAVVLFVVSLAAG